MKISYDKTLDAWIVTSRDNVVVSFKYRWQALNYVDSQPDV